MCISLVYILYNSSAGFGSNRIMTGKITISRDVKQVRIVLACAFFDFMYVVHHVKCTFLYSILAGPFP